MADDNGFADVINLLAAPLAGGIRTIEQFRRGVDEFLRAVDNLNRTLENLNETTTRVNRIVGDLEEPIRALMPQITRTVKAADEITKRLEGPVAAAAPSIEGIVNTFSSPAFTALPNQISEVMRVMSDMSQRLNPLAQFAENAGGLFGGLRVPGMGGSKPAAPPAPVPAPAPAAEPVAQKAPAKKAPAKKAPAKKASAKKAPTKKS